MNSLIFPGKDRATFFRTITDSDDFANDFGGIKSALADRIAFEEGRFYPELEKLGF